jgi:integrase
MMNTEKFPVLISEEGVSAKIRKFSRIKRGKTYTTFAVEYFLLGKRKQEWRAKFQDAKTAALEACRMISRGQQVSLQLANGDRLEYLRANEVLKPFGVKLDVAAHEYAAARNYLPAGVSLIEAAQSCRIRHDRLIESHTVRKIADEMIAAKRAAKLSEVHLKDLECRLNRFSDDFQMNIGDVTRALLQAWLDKMNAAGRTKRNYFGVVMSLFRFAIKRKYLPKDAIDEIAAVELPKADVGEIEIFTPEELQKIFKACQARVKERGKSRTRKEMIPYLAIAAFCGLRAAEIQRLDWSEIHLDGKERFVEVKAAKAKTASRRIVPISDNCAAWLADHVKDSGPVAAFKRSDKQLFIYIAEKAKVPWKHNGLRHSFCSYRLAAIKNAAQVALEAGNSPQMIFKHYRQVVTEAEAAKWFSIQPKSVK